MALWGSSYLLHDTEAVRLVGSVGSWTNSDRGWIKICFVSDVQRFALERTNERARLTIKWDLALRLISLVQILLRQNALLRADVVEIPRNSSGPRTFEVSGGAGASLLTCEWSAAASNVQFAPPEQNGDNSIELVLTEDAAAELVAGLVDRIASNGTSRS